MKSDTDSDRRDMLRMFIFEVNGFKILQYKISQAKQWRDLPLVALSPLAGTGLLTMPSQLYRATVIS